MTQNYAHELNFSLPASIFYQFFQYCCDFDRLPADMTELVALIEHRVLEDYLEAAPGLEEYVKWNGNCLEWRNGVGELLIYQVKEAHFIFLSDSAGTVRYFYQQIERFFREANLSLY